MQRYSDKTDKTVAEVVVPNSGGSSPLFGLLKSCCRCPMPEVEAKPLWSRYNYVRVWKGMCIYFGPEVFPYLCINRDSWLVRLLDATCAGPATLIFLFHDIAQPRGVVMSRNCLPAGSSVTLARIVLRIRVCASPLTAACRS